MDPDIIKSVNKRMNDIAIEVSRLEYNFNYTYVMRLLHSELLYLERLERELENEQK